MEPASAPQSCGFGYRYVHTLMMFFCLAIAYAGRVSTSVGIVAMTTNNTHGFPTYDWPKSTQDTILSSFFWGYVIPQIPAGIVATKFGGKFLLLAGMLCNGVLNIALPFAAESGWMAVCACRILMGFSQGFLFPSTHGILGKWCPQQERGRLSTFVYAGSQFGTVLEMIIAGVLSSSSLGWPSIYYSVGICGLIWSALWLFLGANTPAQCRFVSNAERKHIESSIPNSDSLTKHAIPWGKILTSLPFYSLLVVHIGQAFGFWVLLTEMPSYMAKVLDVDIKSNGVFSALPYLAMFLFSLLSSNISDFISRRGWLSTTNLRKLFNTIAFWGPSAALLALAYLPGQNILLAVTLLTITVGLNGAHYVGFMMVHIDMSSNFAGALMGVTNCISNIFSIMAPLSVSFVVHDETMASEWRKVFFVAIAFYFLGNLFFILFGSSDRQAWDDPTSVSGKSKIDSEKGEKSNDENSENIKHVGQTSL